MLVSRKIPIVAPSIRREYENHGVAGFYLEGGSTYQNPHEPQIRLSLQRVVPAWKLDLSRVLDLAAGSGEVTLALRELGAEKIDGIDPYTHQAYCDRTGQPASKETFETIADGALSDRRYSLIACSFALHLVDLSRLPQLAYQLSLIAPQLLVITPHKRPQIQSAWGWELTEEAVYQRVRSRLYRSRA